MSDPTPLLAVPNVSEGRDRAVIDVIAAAFTAGGHTRLLDVHADPDHHRAVLTLAGSPGTLADALVVGAREAVERVDVMSDPPARGEHPHVGAVDVVPVVYLVDAMRGAACAEALVAAEGIGSELGVPVFIYGELGGGRTRADLRRGGVAGLAARMGSGETTPDFGPSRMHATAGAALVGARRPLVAFNLELAPPAGVAQAREIASLIREGGMEGLPGVRAIGVELRRTGAPDTKRRESEARSADSERGETETGRCPVGQVSINVERPAEIPLSKVVWAVRRHAPVARAELVGMAPRVALEGFPDDVPMPGFDPARHVIENALGL
jgi:glutamate formiminotransferase/glutamate formiminotransferase/formiminotetrahydrofolate cyclodeaminase